MEILDRQTIDLLYDIRSLATQAAESENIRQQLENAGAIQGSAEELIDLFLPDDEDDGLPRVESIQVPQDAAAVLFLNIAAEGGIDDLEAEPAEMLQKARSIWLTAKQLALLLKEQHPVEGCHYLLTGIQFSTREALENQDFRQQQQEARCIHQMLVEIVTLLGHHQDRLPRVQHLQNPSTPKVELFQQIVYETEGGLVELSTDQLLQKTLTIWPAVRREG